MTREDRLREMVWHDGDLEPAGPDPVTRARRLAAARRARRASERQRAVQEGLDEAPA